MVGSVDVIIAAWNRADTIERALLSALREPEVRTVIVVDDGSSDDTAARAERIAAEHSGRGVVRRLPTNRGPAAARNAGLEMSTAAWVAILDGDDFFLPGRIKGLLAHADDYDFVADDLLQVQEGQEAAPASSLLGPNFESWQLNLEAFVLGNVSRRGRLRKELGFLKPLMRRTFLDRHGLRYDESLRLGEDYAFYANALALRARFRVVPARGYVYVERSSSLSGSHTKEELERFRNVDINLEKIAGITARERRVLRRHYESVDARAQWVGVIDAVKERSPFDFFVPFFRSRTVSVFLIRNLLQQGVLRSGKRLLELRRGLRAFLQKVFQNGRESM